MVKKGERRKCRSKRDRRDILQVLANGGVAAMGSLLYSWTSDPLWVIVMASSLAAATADTWASEIGRLSRSAPRDVFSWKRVQPGTSGAITGLGTVASIFGAIIAAIVSIPLLMKVELSAHLLIWLSIVIFSGWTGNWVDTWVGAKWQVRYQCTTCMQVTEKKVHCQQPTRQIEGVYWLDNDSVNACCTLSAGIISGFFYILVTML